MGRLDGEVAFITGGARVWEFLMCVCLLVKVGSLWLC